MSLNALRPRTLIYTRTHSGDPDPKTGEFGNRDCMGEVRAWDFGAVIGVGGRGAEAVRNKIAQKITWVGIGPHKRASGTKRGPVVTFDLFRYFGEAGPAFATHAPLLAARHFRVLMSDRLTDAEMAEADRILCFAAKAPPPGAPAGTRRAKATRPCPPCGRAGSGCR